ncbi:hypothetical protein VIGAN_01416500 [Vigna angularis var. angularis]|uniref:Uncharacterized protein n=1 Tax=Vigna angularis var. angularis TaxID=157739 RepID=A0A0S3R6A9_PHAAN|nr:hypothetical protein VIGAN_01416500 [Vigna angularis var. angularis]
MYNAMQLFLCLKYHNLVDLNWFSFIPFICYIEKRDFLWYFFLDGVKRKIQMEVFEIFSRPQFWYTQIKGFQIRSFKGSEINQMFHLSLGKHATLFCSLNFRQRQSPGKLH